MTPGWNILEVLHELLLLLEDVLELTQGGLHLLQGELLLISILAVLSHPGVELIDGRVEELPLLDEGVNLLDPFVGNHLHLLITFLELLDFIVGINVGGNLEGGRSGISEDLEVLGARLLELLD